MTQIDWNGSKEDLIYIIKTLIKKGQAKRIIIKDDAGKIKVDIPITVGVFGIIMAPFFIGISTGFILVSGCTLEIEEHPE